MKWPIRGNRTSAQNSTSLPPLAPEGINHSWFYDCQTRIHVIPDDDGDVVVVDGVQKSQWKTVTFNWECVFFCCLLPWINNQTSGRVGFRPGYLEFVIWRACFLLYLFLCTPLNDDAGLTWVHWWLFRPCFNSSNDVSGVARLNFVSWGLSEEEASRGQEGMFLTRRGWGIERYVNEAAEYRGFKGCFVLDVVELSRRLSCVLRRMEGISF